MTTEDTALILGQLDPHDKAIREDEGRSITARWKFGKVLLDHRGDNGRLRHGLRKQITERFGLEASEITRRMQLADKFKTEKQLMDACTRCGGSWRRIIAEKLPKTPRKEKPLPPWDERAEANLAWWRSVARKTPEYNQKWVTLLRDALREAEADMATDTSADIAEAEK